MEAKITAIIVDDEVDGREVLNDLLHQYYPQIKLLGIASNVEEAHKLILKTNPQLVFLDIQMPKANGFNLLTKFNPVKFEVIFVTSYDQYAINAIKFNALDYILKPVEVDDLKESIYRAVAKIEKKIENSLQIINLLYSLDNNQNDKKITVHVAEKVKVLNAKEIIYIEADGRYCKLFMNDKQSYVTAKLLKDFEDYLGETSSFIRISKSLLINSFFIKSYSKGDPFFIELSNEVIFEIPRRKKTEILSKLIAR